jgi:glyoxylase-like metal-dependent hydrolase (beta-lactamase superfamily II)
MVLLESTVGFAKSRGIHEAENMLNNLGLTTIPTPGHTHGSVCFYSESEALLISGDTVFADGYFGRTDLPGGDDKEMLKSLKLLKKMKINSILPGHGEFIMENGSAAVSAALSNANTLLRR